jgi:hypothetical protein
MLFFANEYGDRVGEVNSAKGQSVEKESMASTCHTSPASPASLSFLRYLPEMLVA